MLTVKTIACGLLLIVSLASFGQVSFHFGPKAGVSYSKLSFKEGNLKPESKYMVGFQGGAFARIDINKFYIQPEVLFTEKGSKISIDNKTTDVKSANISGKINWQTLDTPVLIGYKILDRKVYNIRVNAGPSFSYTLKDGTVLLKKLDDRTYNFKRINTGYQVGLGIDLFNLTFDVRYEGGFNKNSSVLGARPNLFNASVGFKIM